jgi:hypothetical protein
MFKFHTQKHLQQKHANDYVVKNDTYTTIYLVDKILIEHKEKISLILNAKIMTLCRTLEEKLSFVTCLMQLHMSYATKKCHM